MLLLPITLFPALCTSFPRPPFPPGCDGSTPFHFTPTLRGGRHPWQVMHPISYRITVDVISTEEYVLCSGSQRFFACLDFGCGDHNHQMYGWKYPLHIAPPRLWSRTVRKANRVTWTARKHRRICCRQKAKQYSKLPSCFSYSTKYFQSSALHTLHNKQYNK